MVLDARQTSRNITPLAENIRSALSQAIETQRYVSTNHLAPTELPLFAQPDSTLLLLGNRLGELETQHIDEGSLPAIFNSLSEALYYDTTHTDYGHYPNQAPNTPAAMGAYQDMRSSIEQSSQSAERDMYSFQTLGARPMLWITDYV